MIKMRKPLVDAVLKADSRNTEGLSLRALIRLNEGKVDDAISDLRSALNDQPNSVPLLAALATAYERNGAIDLADRAYSDAMKASRYAPAIGLNYVAFLDRRGLADQADNVLTQLATRNPNNIAVLSALAKSKLAQHDWVAAQRIATEIQHLNSKSTLSAQITGAALAGQRKLDDSVTVLEGAYNQNPGIQPMAQLVNAYMQAGKVEKAKEFLRSALKANPKNVEALTLLGSIAVSQKNLPEAESHFKAAIALQPKVPVGYVALARLYMGEKKFDEAIKTVKEGLNQQPKDYALRLTLGGLLEIKGEYEAAITLYEFMLKDQPGSLVIANNLASLLSDHRTDKDSLQKAQTIATILKDSPVPQFKDTLGWIDYRLGDYKAAVQILEDAASKLPNVAVVQYHLGMSYLANGQTEKATEQLKKAQKLAGNDQELKAKVDNAIQKLSAENKG